MSQAPPTIAATSTLAMVRTASERGIDASGVLREAGITLEAIEDPDARLAAPTVLSIWNALRAQTADPALQLVAPTSLPYGAYRVIEYLIAASTTVGDGVDRFARFFGLIADGLTLTVTASDGERSLCLTTADGGPVPPVYVDYVFAALVSRIRMRIRPDLAVRRVELRQREPQHSARHREVFGAPIHFGATADRLCFSAAEWNRPTTSGDAALVKLMEDHARVLARRAPQPASGFSSEVQKAITSTLADGGSVTKVARALNVSVRTLQRKLIASGTTFRQVSDAVRGRLAQGYLTDPKVSISEVAFLLGFSEESAFNRAFRRWTGESPGQWRKRH